MTRTMTVFALTGLTGLVLMMSYAVIGAEVTPAGVLGEAFFLVPLGFALAGIGLIGSTVSFAAKLLVPVRRT